MKGYLRLTLAAALLITVHEAPAAAQRDSPPQATLVAPCDMRLRVELTPDVSNPGDAEFISSLVGNNPDYQLSLGRSDLENSSVIALSLTGPGPEAPVVQRIGTVRAGPDGDWILEPLNGVSYAHQAIDRYECDIGAVDQTGFDPTKDDGGVPPDALPGKRADYLRAEAACFQARGYVVM